MGETIQPSPPDAEVELVRQLYDVAFRQRRPDLVARLLERGFRHRKAQTTSDRRTYLNTLEEFVGTYPFLQVDLVNVEKTEDAVMAEARIVREPGDTPIIARSSFRVVSGRILEQRDA